MRATRRSIFGLQKGVVGYTLVANHIPVNARIIGAHEHESHFVFDLLLQQYDGHPAECPLHRYAWHQRGQFRTAAPCSTISLRRAIRRSREKVRTSPYGFHHRSQYGDLILKPIRKIQTELIVEEWDNLQRIFVSLARKTTTQSIIVGKLSAYARKNKTRQALWNMTISCAVCTC